MLTDSWSLILHCCSLLDKYRLNNFRSMLNIPKRFFILFRRILWFIESNAFLTSRKMTPQAILSPLGWEPLLRSALVVTSDTGKWLNDWENGCVAVVQGFIRRDGGDDSSMYGKSVSNQQIEALWSILGNDCMRWWIDVFIYDLRRCNRYLDDVYVLVKSRLKFCFMHILQNELNRPTKLYNLHRIWPSDNIESPSSRCYLPFFLTEVWCTRNYMVVVDLDELNLAEEKCWYRSGSQMNSHSWQK